MTLMQGRDITIGYEGDVVIPDFTFTVEQGDYICIVGENGSGKSTFVKTILGLIEPLKGRIAYNGLRGNEIGYLPQRPLIQRDFPSSVMEVVLSGCLNRHRGMFRYAPHEKEKARSVLKRLGMDGRAGDSYQELSGGQQQRVLLARALMATEKLLLLDEPAAGLDPRTSSQMYGIVSSLNSQGITILMVTHDIHPVLNDAKTVFHFSHRSFYQGSKDDYFHTEMGRVFLKEAGHDHQ